MAEPNLTALRRARLLAVVEPVIDGWPIEACEGFRRMIHSPEAESLLILDGDTEVERAANGRALARYFVDCWEELAPRGFAVTVGDLLLDRRPSMAPPLPEPGKGHAEDPLANIDIERLARLVDRLGHEVALRTLRRWMLTQDIEVDSGSR